MKIDIVVNGTTGIPDGKQKMNYQIYLTKTHNSLRELL